MLKGIFKSFQESTEILYEKANEINQSAKDKMNEVKESAKEKAIGLIEEWIEVLPKLTALGLEMTSFGLSMSLSPSLMAELKGPTTLFEEENLNLLLERYKDDKTLKLFLNAIKTTLLLHKKTNATMKEELIIKIEVKFSPEIKVFIGKPELL